MRLGSEVDDRIDVMLVARAFDERFVRDVAADQAVAPGFRKIRHVRRVRGVREQIEIDDPAREVRLPEQKADERRADEPATSRNQQIARRAQISDRLGHS